MGNRSRRTGSREEHNLAAQLPGAKKTSRSGYPGPDIEWRGRHIEAKYRDVYNLFVVRCSETFLLELTRRVDP